MQLQEEYKNAVETNQWHRKVELPNKESIMLHSPDILVLFSQTINTDVSNSMQGSNLIGFDLIDSI